MRLHLINAPSLPLPGIDRLQKGELGETMFPPLSILYLAGQVRKDLPKTEIKVTDGFLIGAEKTYSEVDKFSPDVVGISTATVNATGAYKLASWIKRKNPDTLVIMGGVHATSQIEDTLKKSKADFVAIGEGEKILVEVIKRFVKTNNLNKNSVIKPGQRLIVKP